MGAHHSIGYGPSTFQACRIKCIESNHGAPLKRCPLCFGFPSCPRSPRYEVEDISSRVKKCDRTEGGNASALYAHRTSECGAAQRSVEDCVGMGEAGIQLHRTTTICSCPIFCGVCSRRSDFLPAKHGPAGHLRTELRRICMEASAIEGNVAEKDADFLRSWRIAVARPATLS